MASCTEYVPLSPPPLQEGSSHRPYVTYSKRWLVLAIYCLLSMMTAVLWLTFAPAAREFSNYFDHIGSTEINMLSLSFQIIFPFGTVLGAYVSIKHGLRATVLLAGSLALLSCAIRLLAVMLFDASLLGSVPAYSTLFVGQCFGAIAQPLLLNLPGLIASEWFAIEERDLATTIGALFNPLGNAVASILTPSIVSQDTDDDGSPVHGVQSLMIAILAMTAIPVVCAFFIFDNNPPTPPSRSTALRGGVYGTTEVIGKAVVPGTDLAFEKLVTEIKETFNNKDFRIVFLVFSVGLGFFNALLTLLEQILDPYGYTADDCGLMGAVLILCGILGAGVTGVLLDKVCLLSFCVKVNILRLCALDIWRFIDLQTHEYRGLLVASYLGALVSTTSFLLCLARNNLVVLLVVFGCMGFCMLAVLPCALQNAAEITYPIHEDKSAGLLFSGGNILGVPITFALGALCDQKKWWGPFSWIFIVMILPLGMSFVALLFYNGEYKRLKAEVETCTSRGLFN